MVTHPFSPPNKRKLLAFIICCLLLIYFSSVQFSHSVVSNSLRPHGLLRTRPPCPSPTPRVHPNPCLSSQWCHPTIYSSVVPFSSHLQSFPASGSFVMSQLFASPRLLELQQYEFIFNPNDIQGWFPVDSLVSLHLFLISLQLLSDLFKTCLQ